MMLAQAEKSEEVSTGLLRLFDYVRTFHFPTRAEFVSDLERMVNAQAGQAQTGVLQAVAFVLVGVVFLLFGYRYFKALVIINAAAIGALCGMYIGTRTGSAGVTSMPVLMGLAGAVLLGVLAWPTIRYCVCLMGAMAGAVVGMGLWNFAGNALGLQDAGQYAWAGALVGMVAVGMLAFVLFQTCVMVFTSVQGALMVVSGFCALLLAPALGLRESVSPALQDNPYLLTLLVGVPAVLGFAFQHAKERAKVKKKRKETEKPPV